MLLFLPGLLFLAIKVFHRAGFHRRGRLFGFKVGAQFVQRKCVAPTKLLKQRVVRFARAITDGGQSDPRFCWPDWRNLQDGRGRKEFLFVREISRRLHASNRQHPARDVGDNFIFDVIRIANCRISYAGLQTEFF